MKAAQERLGQTSPWRVPVFRDVWLANMASNCGGFIQTVGATWTMMAIGASPQMITLVQTAATLPVLFLALAAGALADNRDRRVLMLVSQLFMVAIALGLSAAAMLNRLTPSMMLAFTFLIGCGQAVNRPAWQASVGDMVPRSALPNAVAMNSMGFNVARSVGPALGGAIVAAAGGAAAFVVNALTFLPLALVLVRWRPVTSRRLLAPEPIGAAMVAGVRYVSMSPILLRVLGRAGLFNISAGSLPALVPLVARDLLGGGPVVYGALLGAFGTGAVVGASLSGRLRDRLSTEHLASGAGLAIALAVAVTAFSHTMILSLAALLVGGAGWVIGLSTFNVTLQLATPRWVVARVLSIYQMANFGGVAVGSALFGALVSVHGISVALLVVVSILIGSAALGRWWPMPPLEDLNLDPSEGWKEPPTVRLLEPRSGPIIVTIEHRVTPDKVDAFLDAMGERRRIRLRDGARGWRLSEDLQVTDLWIERYQVPTWTEYVRHNHRRTKTDESNSQLLRRLRNGAPATVRREVERWPGPSGRKP